MWNIPCLFSPVVPQPAAGLSDALERGLFAVCLNAHWDPKSCTIQKAHIHQHGNMNTNIKRATQVTTLFMLITSTLVVVARGITKAVIVRSSSNDDYLIALSLVSTINNLR